MNYNVSYTVNLRCIRYAKEDDLRLKGEEVSIDITLDPAAAEYFLFKFTPTSFKFKDYTITYVYSEDHLTMYLTDQNYVYICSNFAQVIEDIYKGYMNVSCVDKLLTFLNINFAEISNILSKVNYDDEFASVADNNEVSDIDEFVNFDEEIEGIEEIVEDEESDNKNE